MEAILAIIGIVIALYLIGLFITYVVIPVISIVAIIGAAAGGGIALFMYVRAALEYRNPYARTNPFFSREEGDVYEYHGKNNEENVKRRSYFFGPGFFSLRKTWITSWIYIYEVVMMYKGWMDKVRLRITTDWLRYVVTALLWVGMIAVVASVLVVGGVVSIGIGLLHAAVMLVVMAAVYLVYSILYAVDHFYLWKNSINSICPTCKQRFIVPCYACNNCNRVHRRLIPSPYGIWTHECVCGTRLPATFFNGRNKLEAFCPFCENERLASSSARQFCISLVGGASSGKTTLLASYLHVFEEKLPSLGISYEIPPECRRKMGRLDLAYENAEQLSGTVRGNYTDPYTLLLSGGGLSFTRQYNIFDVAGETFETPDLSGIPYGQDFADSEGLMILVDPLASPGLRREVQDEGASVTTASVFDPALVVNNLANYLRQTSSKTGRMITRPTAVVLTKTDLPVLCQEISSEQLSREVSQYPGDARTIQDQLCRDFLQRNDFGPLLMALDANFSNYHFFTVTATGGAVPGETYRADPLLEEPFNWLICSSGDEELIRAMGLTPEENKTAHSLRRSR